MSQKQQVTHLFESDSERDHRLHCLSTNQLLRTANESSLQNSSRLKQLSTNQQQRLADETPLQRETRLSQVRGNRSRQHPQVPLHHIIPAFDDPQVHTAMRNFYAKISSITIPVCITCMEKFPGTKMKFKSLECCRCSRDKHIPKLYSAQNNMHLLETFLHLQVKFNVKL